MKRLKKRFEDWMTVITYAEAGEAEMGLCITGIKATQKDKVSQEAAGVVKSAEPEVVIESRENVQVWTEPQDPHETRMPIKEKLEVMVVDDEPIVCRRLKPALAKYGYDVEVFENPVEAMNRFDEKQFDIVVTDLRMEDLDGIGVLEHVLSKSKKTKVIFITGYATVENAREALIKGAFDFIAKPFKINDLRMAITKAALSLGYRGAVAGAAA